jgi:hypothetical protein
MADLPAKGDSGPVRTGRTAKPVRGTAAGIGVVVVNRATAKAPEPPPEEPPRPDPATSRPPLRSTQARLPALQLRTAESVSAQQVLAVLSSRSMIEDWQLAHDLGVAPDALEKILLELEDEGQVRLMPLGDGQRMVVRID